MFNRLVKIHQFSNGEIPYQWLLNRMLDATTEFVLYTCELATTEIIYCKRLISRDGSEGPVSLEFRAFLMKYRDKILQPPLCL